MIFPSDVTEEVSRAISNNTTNEVPTVKSPTCVMDKHKNFPHEKGKPSTLMVHLEGGKKFFALCAPFVLSRLWRWEEKHRRKEENLCGKFSRSCCCDFPTCPLVCLFSIRFWPFAPVFELKWEWKAWYECQSLAATMIALIALQPNKLNYACTSRWFVSTICWLFGSPRRILHRKLSLWSSSQSPQDLSVIPKNSASKKRGKIQLIPRHRKTPERN